MDNLNYKDINIQSYLNSSTIYPELAVNFKTNFRNGNNNLSCTLGCKHEDSQENVLKCEVVQSVVTEITTANVQYLDIFSKHVSKIKSTELLLDKAFKARQSILDKSATSTTSNSWRGKPDKYFRPT